MNQPFISPAEAMERAFSCHCILLHKGPLAMLSLLVTKHAQYDDGEELPLESSLRMFAGTYVLSRGRSTFGGPEAYTDWDPF